MHTFLKPVFIFSGIIIGIAFLHWFLIQIYVKLCSPSTVHGMFSYFSTLGSPFCQFINYLQFELSKHYITVWGTAAVALAAYLLGKLNIKK
tara:strand:+ start:611 stop:883 length:273 start_codon:yes stop_codon:yes gene_type:complete